MPVFNKLVETMTADDLETLMYILYAHGVHIRWAFIAGARLLELVPSASPEQAMRMLAPFSRFEWSGAFSCYREEARRIWEAMKLPQDDRRYRMLCWYTRGGER